MYAILEAILKYMIKISGKVDKSNTYNGYSSNISFFIHRRRTSDKTVFEFFYILAIEKTRENEAIGNKGGKGSKDKRQIREEYGEK